MLDKLSKAGFEIRHECHAAAILEKDTPLALGDLEEALLNLAVPITEIIGSGGGEAKLTQRMRHAFNRLGWTKTTFEISKTINGVPRESISHEVDHVKAFNLYNIALEIEWNN
ncbi:MAG TPA: BglII/BstYI family type II restriction endonuclease, partial [Verrucomicrobiae bacterium]|nr:BglII/BstYI family type II restriction endonuclease [Verrucomicrobiae bacterium]